MRCPWRGVNDAFMAVQHIARAVLLRRCANIGKVVAPLWLSICKANYDISANDFRDNRVSDSAANSLQSTAAQDDGLEIRLNRDDLAKLFHNQRIFEISATKAAMFFAEGRTKHAKILRQCLPNACITPAAAGDHLAAAVEIVGVRQKAAQCVADHVLRFGVAEIHYSYPVQ